MVHKIEREELPLLEFMDDRLYFLKRKVCERLQLQYQATVLCSYFRMLG
jgi:hypothetical protein